MKELDFVRNIFAASDDFEGKGLHAKAEEVLGMLAKKVITLGDATNIMLQFFKCKTPSPYILKYHVTNLCSPSTLLNCYSLYKLRKHDHVVVP
jgi:hypothetical protein